MKRLVTALLTVTLLFASIGSVSAQDRPSSIAVGFDTPATYIDSRGREVATLSVIDVNSDWEEYDNYYSPDRGNVFRAVTFTVTNVSDTPLVVRNYDFTLIDVTGRSISSAWVEATDDAETEIFIADVPLAAGESADLTMVFETLSGIEGAALVWQTEYGMLVMVHFAGFDAVDAAVVVGFGTEATWTDDRGRPIASFAVTDVEANWTAHDEYSVPARGQFYKAVHFTITNVSDTSMIVNPNGFSLLDNGGIVTSRSWVSANDGTTLFEGDVPLGAGEVYEATLIFAIYSDLEPVALIWQPDYGLTTIVIMGDDGVPVQETVNPLDREATPAS